MSALCQQQNRASPYKKTYFLSTQQMLWHARNSPCSEFIVGTEKGMLYPLRKLLPEKRFYPVSESAVCEYMKMNTMEKLLDSLRNDQVEIKVDPEIQMRARKAIQHMLTIQ